MFFSILIKRKNLSGLFEFDALRYGVVQKRHHLKGEVVVQDLKVFRNRCEIHVPLTGKIVIPLYSASHQTQTIQIGFFRLIRLEKKLQYKCD